MLHNNFKKVKGLVENSLKLVENSLITIHIKSKVGNDSKKRYFS